MICKWFDEHHNIYLWINKRPDFFLLVDVREFFFRFRVGGTNKNKISSENTQFFFSFSELFFFFKYLRKKTVIQVR